MLSNEIFHRQPLKPAIQYAMARHAVFQGTTVLEGHIMAQHPAIPFFPIVCFNVIF
jgi:hypothetical protein